MNIASRLLRLEAIVQKEFISIKRDYLTYLILVLVPFLEVILFGYLINTDPKSIPTLVVAGDQSAYTRTLIVGLQNTGYFKINGVVQNKDEGDKALKNGSTIFVLSIPAHFSRDLVRGDRPEILLEADATDPVGIVNASRIAANMSQNILDRDLKGTLNYLLPIPNNGPFQLNIQAKFNPEILAKYHMVPGLITSILGITFVLLMSISLAAEFEQGTLETLLVTPTKPIEVILGKLLPFLCMGYILLCSMLALSYWLFAIPFFGSLPLLLLLALPYLLTCLLTGLTFSTITSSQLQAANFTNLYNLPSLLFSGFVFPFYGMPEWGQFIGNLLPMTHFMRIMNGIMLKGATFTEVWPDTWPILAFLVIILYITIRFYRQTLD